LFSIGARVPPLILIDIERWQTTAADNAKPTISATKIKVDLFQLNSPSQSGLYHAEIYPQLDFIGQQTTTRTGPLGNTLTTNRSYGNGQQTTTRTGPNGNTITTNRSYGNGQLNTTRTGPLGNTLKTNRSINH
jgi:hypothetical protein